MFTIISSDLQTVDFCYMSLIQSYLTETLYINLMDANKFYLLVPLHKNVSVEGFLQKSVNCKWTSSSSVDIQTGV